MCFNLNKHFSLFVKYVNQVGGPTYVGVVSDGRPVRDRAGEHFGSATWPSQVDTDKPVGVHFRGPGHVPQMDFTFLSIEKVKEKDPFNIRLQLMTADNNKNQPRDLNFGTHITCRV